MRRRLHVPSATRRSVLLGTVAALAVSWGGAQTTRGAPLVLLLLPGSATGTETKDTFLQGMKDVGRVEGDSFRFEVHYADGDTGRYATLIREAVARRPAVIVIAGLLGARAARDATSQIPVVVATGSDMVDAGIVAGYARPGGNITGLSDLTDESASKRFELLRTALPNARRVALLVNADFPATPKIEARVTEIAAVAGIAITVVRMRDRASMLTGIDTLASVRPDALLAAGDPVATTFRNDLIARATAVRVPVVHYWPGSAEQGALLSLEIDVDDNFRRAARYVDKILKGAKPAELPIERPTRYRLVLNLRAAKALGRAIPKALELRADDVIR